MTTPILAPWEIFLAAEAENERVYQEARKTYEETKAKILETYLAEVQRTRPIE